MGSNLNHKAAQRVFSDVPGSVWIKSATQSRAGIAEDVDLGRLRSVSCFVVGDELVPRHLFLEQRTIAPGQKTGAQHTLSGEVAAAWLAFCSSLAGVGRRSAEASCGSSVRPSVWSTCAWSTRTPDGTGSVRRNLHQIGRAGESTPPGVPDLRRGHPKMTQFDRIGIHRNMDHLGLKRTNHLQAVGRDHPPRTHRVRWSMSRHRHVACH